jgi:hypothetical protein
MSAPAPVTVNTPLACVALPASPTFPMSEFAQGAGNGGWDPVILIGTPDETVCALPESVAATVSV